MNVVTAQLLRVVAVEAFQYRRVIVGAFVALNVLAAIVGLSWPEMYSTSTTILVQERNIIQPLMQGAAVPTEVMNRARIAREIIYSRRVMNQALDWTDPPSPETTAAERDRIIDGITRRTVVTTVPSQGIIRLEYKDKDPERAYRLTTKLAEAFISESFGAKASESTSAFEFIDKQVNEYHAKLMKVEDELKEFRASNADMGPGSQIDVGSRISQIRQTIELTERQLKETEVRKASLERQLAGEAESASALTKEGQYRTRISELQSQLETLRLTYHDAYPDIIRLRNQIEDLKQAATAEQARRATARQSGQAVIDESVVIHNPIYQQIRQQQLQTKTEIDTLNARIAEAKRQVRTEVDLSKRVAGSESAVTQLTRDYQVNKDIHQDLLRRRENARVSMNLDTEKQGLTFRIHEPPVRPTIPVGPQFIDVAMLGFVLSIALPLGVLFLLVKFDPRFRLSSLLEARLKLPLLGSVPPLWVPAQISAARADFIRLGAVMLATLFFVVAFVGLHMAKVV